LGGSCVSEKVEDGDQDAQGTGIAAADFSCICRVNLGRFTVDGLMRILRLLDQEAEISVDGHPRRKRNAAVGLPAA
jgi:hypothetical protein